MIIKYSYKCYNYREYDEIQKKLESLFLVNNK